MPSSRSSSGSSRPSRPSTRMTSSTGKARTEANERRKPAVSKKDNPYKRGEQKPTSRRGVKQTDTRGSGSSVKRSGYKKDETRGTERDFKKPAAPRRTGTSSSRAEPRGERSDYKKTGESRGRSDFKKPSDSRTSDGRRGAPSTRGTSTRGTSARPATGASRSATGGRGIAARSDSRRTDSRGGGARGDDRERDARRTSSRSDDARDGRRSYSRSDSRSDSRSGSRSDSRTGSRPTSRTGYRGRDDREREPELPRRKGWGSLARKGAAKVKEEGPGRKSSREEERTEVPRADSGEWEFKRVDSPKKRIVKSSVKAEKSTAEPVRISPDAIKEIEERAGKRSERMLRYLRDAARAYATERWGDARKALRPLLVEVADAPVVQELNGMVFYRTGKWAAAYKELEASHAQTLSYDLYPAMMDCARALKQIKKVEKLWTELKESSPPPEVMAEGRIVYASTLASQGKFEEGIRLLEKMPRPRRDPKSYHLRTWYVLGDLYEKTEDIGKARVTFERVAHHDPDLADVLDRIEGLG